MVKHLVVNFLKNQLAFDSHPSSQYGVLDWVTTTSSLRYTVALAVCFEAIEVGGCNYQKVTLIQCNSLVCKTVNHSPSLMFSMACISNGALGCYEESRA